ncbi:MAG: thioredoxin domain-containing protein, partial [Myxococcota bacterium]
GRTASAQGAAGSTAPIIGSKSMVAVAAVAAVLYWASSTIEDVESPPPPQQPVTAMLRVSESDSQPRAGVETAARQVVASARKAQPRMVPPATAADYASLPSRSFESQVQFVDGTRCERSFVTLKLTPFEPDPQCASIAGDRKQEVVCPDGAGSFDAFAGSPLSGRIRFDSVPPGRYPVQVLCQGRGSDGAPLSLIRDFVWDARSDGDVRWTLERPEGFRNSEPKEATGVAEKRRMIGVLSKPFDAGVFDLSKAVPAASSQRNVASKRGQTQGVQIGVPGSSKGAASAPVQLLEVISTVTPFSAPVHRSMLQLVQDFPQDVQVTTYVSPLWAGETAVRALCAAEDQGGFEAYLSLLHAQPRPPGKRPSPLAEAKMLDLAAEAGLNRSEFESRFNSRYCRVYVETLGAHLEELGVKVAPAIFINGEAFPGARSYADYRALVESQLQR